MTAKDFKRKKGKRFYFRDHRSFVPDEIFTVEKVCDDYITAQSNKPRWRDAPMIITDTSLAEFDDQIVFIRGRE